MTSITTISNQNPRLFQYFNELFSSLKKKKDVRPQTACGAWVRGVDVSEKDLNFRVLLILLIVFRMTWMYSEFSVSFYFGVNVRAPIIWHFYYHYSGRCITWPRQYPAASYKLYKLLCFFVTIEVNSSLSRCVNTL